MVGFAIYSPKALLTNIRHSDQIKPLDHRIQKNLCVYPSGPYRRASEVIFNLPAQLYLVVICNHI